MNTTHLASLSPHDVLSLLARYRRWWLATTAIFFVVAAVYAGLRPRMWQASQALVVRNDSADANEPVGSYDRAAERKSTQETLVELTRSQRVLQAALEDVGPPSARRRTGWPSPQDVQDLLRALKFLPPKGAEFGTTQVFYLQVKQRDRQRAALLAGSLCRHLIRSHQELAKETARGLVAELERKVALADEDLRNTTQKLSSFEALHADNLAELRILTSHVTGSSDLRDSLVTIENELRQAENASLRITALENLLAEAARNPGHLVATPNTLLESLPALRNLKEGLITAQMHTAAIRGRVTPEHPLYRAALAAENEARSYLLRELEASILGVRTEREINRDQIHAIEQRLARERRRQQEIASLRAEYANLLAAAESRTSRLETARRDLGAAQAKLAAAAVASPIHLVGGTETGPRPLGPGTMVILLAGTLGGLLVGLGGVFAAAPLPALSASPANDPGRIPPRPVASPRPWDRQDFSIVTLKNAFRGWKGQAT